MYSLCMHMFICICISLICSVIPDSLQRARRVIVLEDDEGQHIAEAIGPKKAVILQNHGLLTCADSVEATVFWYVSLEKLCQTHLLAMAAVGGDESRIAKVGDKEAAT